MKKIQIYEDEDIEVYKKNGDVEIGYEAETAMNLVVAGLIGAKQFAGHLKDPIEYWAKFAEDVVNLMDDTETEIRKNTAEL